MTRSPQLSLLDPLLQVAQDRGDWHVRITAEQTRRLDSHFPRPGCSATTARALYVALEAIGNKRRPDRSRPLRPSDWFEASRSELAQRVRVRSTRTLGPYLDALVEIGLLTRRRRRRQPNLWQLPLTLGDSRKATTGDSRKATTDTSSDQGRQRPTGQLGVSKATNGTPLKKDGQENNVVGLSPRDDRRERQAQRLAAADRVAAADRAQWGASA